MTDPQARPSNCARAVTFLLLPPRTTRIYMHLYLQAPPSCCSLQEHPNCRLYLCAALPPAYQSRSPTTLLRRRALPATPRWAGATAVDIAEAIPAMVLPPVLVHRVVAFELILFTRALWADRPLLALALGGVWRGDGGCEWRWSPVRGSFGLLACSCERSRLTPQNSLSVAFASSRVICDMINLALARRFSATRSSAEDMWRCSSSRAC